MPCKTDRCKKIQIDARLLGKDLPNRSLEFRTFIMNRIGSSIVLICFGLAALELSAGTVSPGGAGNHSGYVTLGAPPANDNYADATIIPGAGGKFVGSNESASKEWDEPDHADEPGGASVWWQWKASGGSVATINTYGSDFSTVLAVYKKGPWVGGLEEVESHKPAAGKVSQVRFSIEAGETYMIAVDGVGGATGNIVLNVAPSPPANDNFVSASQVPAAGGQVSGTNLGATREMGEPWHAGQIEMASVWWKWQPDADGFVTISTRGSDFDTILAVYTGNQIWNLSEVASHVPAAGKENQVQFSAMAGTTYMIALDGQGGATGEILLSVDLGEPLMTIVGITLEGGQWRILVDASLLDIRCVLAEFRDSLTNGAPWELAATQTIENLGNGLYRLSVPDTGLSNGFFRAVGIR